MTDALKLADRLALPNMNKTRHEERMLNGDERDLIVRALRALAATPAVGGERDILQKLHNEIAGIWSAFEHELRSGFGHTNYACVQVRLDEAKAILAAQPASPLRAAAERVCWFDWSSNDPDASASIDALRAALCSCGGDKDQPASAHDISCPNALSASPLRGRDDAIAECAEIADKYDDCGGSFIAQKIRDLALAAPPEQPAAVWTEQDITEAKAEAKAMYNYFHPEQPAAEGLWDQAFKTAELLESDETMTRDFRSFLAKQLRKALDQDKQPLDGETGV